jgi:hypothetical protein
MTFGSLPVCLGLWGVPHNKKAMRLGPDGPGWGCPAKAVGAAKAVNCLDSCSPRRPFEANASEVAGNNFGAIGMRSRAAMEVALAHRPRRQSAPQD